MDSISKLLVLRALNEYKLSIAIFNLSLNEDVQEKLGVEKPETYYSAVISHCYYSIFYLAKAYLRSKDISVFAPEEHKKTYEEFEKLVSSGKVDFELLKIYQSIMIKADTLLGIFKTEKKKRGDFTYKRLPQANKNPAEESIKNAEKFYKHIIVLLEEDSLY